MSRIAFLLTMWIGLSVALWASDYKPSAAEQKKVVEQFRKQGLGSDLTWEPLSAKGRYVVKLGDRKIGTLFFRQLIPKMERFSYFTLLDDKGTVLSFGILSYVSRYGAAIGKPGWGGSFVGKKVEDLKVGKEIDAISGATLSLNALSADFHKLKRML